MKLKELHACIANRTPVYVHGYRAIVVATRQPRIVPGFGREWHDAKDGVRVKFDNALEALGDKPCAGCSDWRGTPIPTNYDKAERVVLARNIIAMTEHEAQRDAMRLRAISEDERAIRLVNVRRVIGGYIDRGSIVLSLEEAAALADIVVEARSKQ